MPSAWSSSPVGGTPDIPGVVPLRLDITEPASIEAVAGEVGDLDILVNNAGISTDAQLLGPSTENVRREFDTTFWGTLNVTRAFAPRLAGGAILNAISALTTTSPSSHHTRWPPRPSTAWKPANWK